jgi:hypothetical protein
LIFFLNSLHLEELTQKFSLFLELYKNSIEIKKKLILFIFLKKKNKNFISGRFSSSSMARPSYVRPTRTLAPAPVLARVARSSGPLALAHSLPLALTDAAAPPVISLLRHSLSSLVARP